MPRTLHDFIGKHAGDTAWLFGKGPSLDLFDLAAAGPLRVAINDVVKEIPGCLYGFANDSVAHWQHVYRPGHVLFSPQRTIDEGFIAYGKPPCEVVGYPDVHGDDRLDWPAARLAAEGLAIRPGTLGSALQILALMGVRRVVCIGIDGGGRHADRQWHTRLRNEHYKDYNRIRDGAIESAPRLGLTLEFFHPAHNPDGTMKLLILKSSVVRAHADVEAGQIVNDIPEREARALVIEGCATANADVIAAEEARLAEASSQRAAVAAQEAGHAVEAAVATPVAEKAIAAGSPARKPRASRN